MIRLLRWLADPSFSPIETMVIVVAAIFVGLYSPPWYVCAALAFATAILSAWVAHIIRFHLNERDMIREWMRGGK